MKNLMLSTLTLFILILNTKAQEVKNIRYFDIDNKEINKSVFDEKRSTNVFLDIPGDSSNHRKLINREEQGKIKDKTKLLLLLETASNKEIDSLKPIVIIYHPGQDSSNSTGNTDYIKAKHKELKTALLKQYKIKPIYIYAEITGTGQYGSSINWIKDPEQSIKKHFFKYHYPSGSFVVIDRNGNYVSYLGEYMTSAILAVTKKMTE
ncbi:hypothetical protein ASE74_19695 [Pedobacter sp. Leaf216]|uniref:hypothetical protein n=1 Tax=Pedobacter sp. Leaf216 TaxID=1735684 RepID=UPI0006FC336B|nr:hypothetical protein [Pedobacter sp. Leaf216]KQM76277.1 hypothetical protein ASE74_19695 [Pedobacter sp. Leaf216]